MPRICRLLPNQYVHVEDTNTCEVLTLVGPLTFTLYDHHHVVHDAPQPCIVVPPNHYVVITNPVSRSGGEAASQKECGGYPLVSNDPRALKLPLVAQCAQGSVAYRYTQPPFPLFPGEAASAAHRMVLLAENEALLLEATDDLDDKDENSNNNNKLTAGAQKRKKGDKYYFKGPGYYLPRVGEHVLRSITATCMRASEALYLRATEAFVGADGKQRVAGEEWTVSGVSGFYFPPAHATIYTHKKPIALTATLAIHVRALFDFVDAQTKVKRAKGTEWLVSRDTHELFTPTHQEELVRHVQLVQVGSRQYCVVLRSHTVNTTSNSSSASQRGKRCELRTGPCSFFLDPGESLEGGSVHNTFLLSPVEALLLEAVEPFTDRDGVERSVSARWLIRGPCSYIPELSVRVLEKRRVITLDQGDGVYVRNVRTGRITSVYGAPFLLSEEEELWEKPVSAYTRCLLQSPRLSVRREECPCIDELWEHHASQDAHQAMSAHESCTSLRRSGAPAGNNSNNINTTRSSKAHVGVKTQPPDIKPYAVVSLNVENNTLIRLYDTSKGSSRVIAGPSSVCLGPYEEFTPMVLSGGRPKTPCQIHSLALFLGPDYMADCIEVETLDHARLKLQLSYNWEFDTRDAEKIQDIAFTIPDLIGEACKALASRVRNAIASVSFEEVHRNSSSLIKQAVFSASGTDSAATFLRGGAVLYFTANGLCITNVDIQSVEPVDLKTRVALTKSVQLAVEIITKSQENEATHNAALIEQEAQGHLDLQVMEDRASAETERVQLLGVIAENAAIEQIGASVAQALAESEARVVDAQSELDTTPLRCTAHECSVDAELAILQQRMDADLAHSKAMNELVIKKAKALADIAATRYEKVMRALGQDTVIALARAGPELQAKLLSGLGLQGFLVTDGTAPINLSTVAGKLVEHK